jgi:anti-sigma regulatory factor (Ser/Thr protein kinase)
MTEAFAGPESVQRRLPPAPSSVGAARDVVRDLLDSSGRNDLVEPATLLVSEVVTNAILHAGTEIDVRASLDDTGLRVEVADGSEHLPTRRRYERTAGTGRGLMLLEELVDDWGVSRHAEGKTVWFHLPSSGRGDEPVSRSADDGPPARRMAGDAVAVQLLDMPLRLHAVWQEHAEALLREYLLHTLDDDTETDAIQVHADATDAIAILEEQVPAVDVALDPPPSYEDLVIDVPLASVRSFETMNRTVEAAVGLARDGRILTPATRPDLQTFRRWVCNQVVGQAAGRPPVRWERITTGPW